MEVDLHHPVEILKVQGIEFPIEHLPGEPHARGGDNAPDWLLCGVDPLKDASCGGFDARGVADVAFPELGVRGGAAEFGDCVGAVVFVEVKDGYVGAEGVKVEGCCAAEAGGAGLVSLGCGVVWGGDVRLTRRRGRRCGL